MDEPLDGGRHVLRQKPMLAPVLGGPGLIGGSDMGPEPPAWSCCLLDTCCFLSVDKAIIPCQEIGSTIIGSNALAPLHRMFYSEARVGASFLI